MRTVVMSLVVLVYLACGSDGTDLHKLWTREVIAGTPHGLTAKILKSVG